MVEMHTEGPIHLVISTKNAAKRFHRGPQGKKHLVICYNLGKPLEFDEPYCARLSYFHFTAAPDQDSLEDLVVHCDFTERQLVDGKLTSILGIGSESNTTQNPYVPLGSNYIPSTGEISFHQLPGLYLAAEQWRQIQVVLWIQLLPTRLAYGATSQA